MKCPRLLGHALLNWSIHRIGPHVPTPNEEEVALAHGVAGEFLELAFAGWKEATDPRDKARWRDLFTHSVSTLALFPTPQSIARLEEWDPKARRTGDVLLAYAFDDAWLAFDDRRAAAMMRLIAADLPPDEASTRDFLLEGILEVPSTMPISPEDRRALVAALRARPYPYSRKHYQRRIERWLKREPE